MFIPIFRYIEEAIQHSSGTGSLTQRNEPTLLISSNTMSPRNLSSATTLHQLSSQWTNPNDVLSVLLIVGGDIVQKALAQASGGYFTPVCFSFGWVAYSLSAIISIVGDGRLLPDPDHPVKVYNLKNGYVRENKNWIIGRILRDNIMRLNKTDPLGGNAIRISVYDAQRSSTSPSIAGKGHVRSFGVVVMVLQLGIAAIPFAVYGEWGILLITVAGTLLALMAGSLPQWRVEKYPEDTQSAKDFALTTGNGSRDIMIIRGNEECLDLEEMAATQMPRSARTWETHPLLSSPIIEGGKPKIHTNGTPYRKTPTYKGIPLGFWITGTVVSVQFALWVALLIAVAGIRSHVWFLLLVGALGMFQNVLVAASSREPEKRNLHLREVEVMVARKVMDGLMDLQVTYEGFGEVLRSEFFPGKLTGDELEWWNGSTEPYDFAREQEAKRRGIPRRYLPRYVESTPRRSPTLPRSSSIPTLVREQSESQIDNSEMISPMIPSDAKHDKRNTPAKGDRISNLQGADTKKTSLSKSEVR